MKKVKLISLQFFFTLFFHSVFCDECVQFDELYPDALFPNSGMYQIENDQTLTDEYQDHVIDEMLSTLPENKKSSQLKKIQKLLKTMVVSTKKINIPGFVKAFNPSIIEDENGYVLIFRYCPDKKAPWISYIGIVMMDKSLNLVSTPQLLNPRLGLLHESPSQAEDARIFSFKGDLYVIYNDNHEVKNPTNLQRRDMYIAKITRHDSFFDISPPVKLMHEEKYKTVLWQKNWSPFVWNDQIMISYTLKPHEVLTTNLEDGICKPCYETPNPINWEYGELRGGTPAVLVDGEYLAFFHSSIETKSKESKFKKMYHYYMGAYTFSAEPPFEITKMTPSPIVGKNFYTISNFHKRVVFPGGFIVDGNKIHVIYGKDDSEVWAATIDKTKLYQTLLPVK